VHSLKQLGKFSLAIGLIRGVIFVTIALIFSKNYIRIVFSLFNKSISSIRPDMLAVCQLLFYLHDFLSVLLSSLKELLSVKHFQERHGLGHLVFQTILEFNIFLLTLYERK